MCVSKHQFERKVRQKCKRETHLALGSHYWNIKLFDKVSYIKGSWIVMLIWNTTDCQSISFVVLCTVIYNITLWIILTCIIVLDKNFVINCSMKNKTLVSCFKSNGKMHIPRIVIITEVKQTICLNLLFITYWTITPLYTT